MWENDLKRRVFDGFIDVEDGCRLAVRFEAEVNDNGSLKMHFEHVPPGAAVDRIDKINEDEVYIFPEFKINGLSGDVEFMSDDLVIQTQTGMQNCVWYRSLHGGCDVAFFSKPCAAKTCDELRFYLKGVGGYGKMEVDSNLGVVRFDSLGSDCCLDEISGYISIFPHGHADEQWWGEAQKLLKHVLRVMSFAAATPLQTPIIERTRASVLSTEVVSCPDQRRAHWRLIYAHEQRDVFLKAVSSYYAPHPDIKNVDMAIEWFMMEPSHREMQLITAMTSIENLLASNIGDRSLIKNEKFFKSKRKDLRNHILPFLKSIGYSCDEAGGVSDKIPELNRYPFKKNFKTFIDEFGIPLSGLCVDGVDNDRMLSDAINARNEVVHQGKYDGEHGDLSRHIAFVREILVRIVFTWLGYEGDYLSYLSGCHRVSFPPSTAKTS